MLIDKNVLNLDKPSQEELVEIVSVCGQSLSGFFSVYCHCAVIQCYMINVYPCCNWHIY